MNPNLPVGGSAFDVTSGVPADGLTVLGMAYGFSFFGSHFAGTDSIDPVRTEEISAHLFNLSLEHHFGGGISGHVRVPVGSIRVDPVAAAPTFVSGFGDLEIGGALELGRFWGTGGYKPSVKIRPSLVLPTGETRRTSMLGDDAPPNLIALGTGAVGFALDVQASKYVARDWAVRGRLGARSPLSFNEEDLRFGAVLSGAAGGLFRPAKKLFVTIDATIAHRRSSRERTMGEVINSGGTWLGFDAAVAYVRGKVAVGATARVPVFADVNGEQVSETFGLGAFVSLSFGGEEDKHGHGDEDGHDHGGEDKHDHGGEDKHDHGGEDKHDHGGEDKHDHGGEKHDKHDHQADVKDLATGGASFDFAAVRVPGKVVAIDFWADWCKPCKGITAALEKRAAANERLAVRKVEVPTFDSPVAQRYLPGVGGLPVVWLVGPDGKVISKLVQVTPAQLDEALDKALEPSSGHHH